MKNSNAENNINLIIKNYIKTQLKIEAHHIAKNNMLNLFHLSKTRELPERIFFELL